MKRRWMGLTLAFLLLAAIFPGRAGADTAAAETGGVRYPTLAGALAALEPGGTLTLLRDGELSAMLTLKADGVTLDLNGYSLAPATGPVSDTL